MFGSGGDERDWGEIFILLLGHSLLRNWLLGLLEAKCGILRNFTVRATLEIGSATWPYLNDRAKLEKEPSVCLQTFSQQCLTDSFQQTASCCSMVSFFLLFVNWRVLIILPTCCFRSHTKHRQHTKYISKCTQHICQHAAHDRPLTHILLTWTKWRAPTSASKWRMGFNSVFKGLNKSVENLVIKEIFEFILPL
jgi:hypothetical protein